MNKRNIKNQNAFKHTVKSNNDDNMGFTLEDNLDKMYKNSAEKPKAEEDPGIKMWEERKNEVDNLEKELITAINNGKIKFTYDPKIKGNHVFISTIIVYSRIYPPPFDIFLIAVEGKNMIDYKTATYAVKYLNNYYILKENTFPMFHSLTVDIKKVTKEEIETEIEKYKANSKYRLIEDKPGREYFAYK